MARFSVFLLGLGVLITTPAQAHLLKVFAFAEGNRIEGSTYFVGGAPASGASVKVMSADGRLLAALEPDASGEFSYEAKVQKDHVIVANTGDGHVAEWTVSAAELTGQESTGQSLPRQSPGLAENGTGIAAPATAADPAATPTNSELAALVEQAVARQVRPLREEIIAYEDKVRLRDIVGGIGYILGLAGLAIWWQQRRRSSR